MKLSTSLINTAKSFQAQFNLDVTDLPSLLLHDCIHSYLGLGVTTAEEDLVGAIELVLDCGATWNTQALELARSLPSELRAHFAHGNI